MADDAEQKIHDAFAADPNCKKVEPVRGTLVVFATKAAVAALKEKRGT